MHYHHPLPERFSSCKTETLFPWNNSLLLQPLAATFCLYKFGNSRCLMQVASCTILCVGVIDLFCLACCPRVSSMVQHTQNFLLILGLNCVTFNVYITLCLSIHPLMDTWVDSPFRLLGIMLLWTWVTNTYVCVCVYNHMGLENSSSEKEGLQGRQK